MLSYRNMRAQAAGAIERLGSMTHTTAPLLPAALPRRRADADRDRAAATSARRSTSANRSAPCRRICARSRRALFLGVPRIWEKLHSAIAHQDRSRPGGLRRRLFERALSPLCEPFAEIRRRERTLGERADVRLLLRPRVPRAAELHRPAPRADRADGRGAHLRRRSCASSAPSACRWSRCTA